MLISYLVAWPAVVAFMGASIVSVLPTRLAAELLEKIVPTIDSTFAEILMIIWPILPGVTVIFTARAVYRFLMKARDKILAGLVRESRIPAGVRVLCCIASGDEARRWLSLLDRVANVPFFVGALPHAIFGAIAAIARRVPVLLVLLAF